MPSKKHRRRGGFITPQLPAEKNRIVTAFAQILPSNEVKLIRSQAGSV